MVVCKFAFRARNLIPDILNVCQEYLTKMIFFLDSLEMIGDIVLASQTLTLNGVMFVQLRSGSANFVPYKPKLKKCRGRYITIIWYT